jgi:RNA-directed DNA polymerase
MTYQEIISRENVRKAYLAVILKFEEQSKTTTYSGFDGIKIDNYNLSSDELIDLISRELIEKKEIDPAIKMLIPKNNKPGKRTIFIHSLKERIKAQAIYQVIEPVFDGYLSDFLFSYRGSHPHYKAAASVAKRYRKNYKDDYILVGDISNYCDNIDKDILRNKIKIFNFDEDTNKLIDLFIENPYIENGVKKHLDLGLVHGEPLISLFYNIYVDDIDKSIGKNISLYRRVGDDFILIDKSLEKINQQKEFLINKLTEYKIDSTKQKIKVLKASEEPFEFLGYKFENGIISIRDRSVKKIIQRWKKQLKFYPVDVEKKITGLKKKIFENNPSMGHDLEQIVRLYSQTTDVDQIKKISEYFFKLITVYLLGSYSDRNHRQAKVMTKDLKFPTLYENYVKVHSGGKANYRKKQYKK